MSKAVARVNNLEALVRRLKIKAQKLLKRSSDLFAEAIAEYQKSATVFNICTCRTFAQKRRADALARQGEELLEELEKTLQQIEALVDGVSDAKEDLEEAKEKLEEFEDDIPRFQLTEAEQGLVVAGTLLEELSYPLGYIPYIGDFASVLGSFGTVLKGFGKFRVDRNFAKEQLKRIDAKIGEAEGVLKGGSRTVINDSDVQLLKAIAETGIKLMGEICQIAQPSQDVNSPDTPKREQSRKPGNKHANDKVAPSRPATTGDGRNNKVTPSDDRIKRTNPQAGGETTNNPGRIKTTSPARGTQFGQKRATSNTSRKKSGSTDIETEKPKRPRREKEKKKCNERKREGTPLGSAINHSIKRWHPCSSLDLGSSRPDIYRDFTVPDPLAWNRVRGAVRTDATFRRIEALTAYLQVYPSVGSKPDDFYKDMISRAKPATALGPYPRIGLDIDSVGHIVGNQFGGYANREKGLGNVFPQVETTNNVDFSRIENESATLILEEFKNVCVVFRFKYKNSLRFLRPTSYKYIRYTLCDGEVEKVETFRFTQ